MEKQTSVLYISRKMKDLNKKIKNSEIMLLSCTYFLVKVNYFLSIIFSSGVNEGRLLMSNPDSTSYAAELEVLSKDEVRIAL